MKRFNIIKWFSVIFFIIIIFAIAGSVLWQQSQFERNSEQATDETTKIETITEPIQPIPLYIELDEKKVELGKRLFHDPRLSGDNSISCVSCHNLAAGGVDRLPNSIGINGAVGSINSPTVFNSGFNFRQFWDGRAETLEDQIDGPIHSPTEMGSSWPEITLKLNESSEYVTTFEELYPDGITGDNIKDAIATFERSLYTPNSRFDQFLRGNSQAITDEEKEGYRLFKEYGCISCHQGVSVGGNLYQKFSIIGNYFTDRGNITEADLGRFNVTGEEQDRHVFKVPSLRNVALTPPYLHDGSVQTLQETISATGSYQLGRPLSPEETMLIEKFLHTLTGEYKGVSLE